MTSVSATAAKNRLGQVLEAAFTGPVTITKTGRKVAVLLSWREYERLQALEDAWWAREAAQAEAEGYLGPRASRQFLRNRLRRAE
jgi:prevent-host-death family protein